MAWVEDSLVDFHTGVAGPPLPTSSMPGQHVAYQDSTNPDLIRPVMVADAHALVRDGTLVPAVGGGGGALRGGFFRGVGAGAVFRFVGMPTPAFPTRYDKYAVLADDPVEAVTSGLRTDLRFCFRSPEWAELEPRCILASKIALEVLPDSASDSERAQAVYGAYHNVVEKFEHKTVWKSTFRRPRWSPCRSNTSLSPNTFTAASSHQRVPPRFAKT